MFLVAWLSMMFILGLNPLEVRLLNSISYELKMLMLSRPAIGMAKNAFNL
jgi:hypothetical protein